MPIRVSRDTREAKVSLRASLQQMLKAVDTAPITRHQKLQLFKFGICSRLTWPLLIEDLPISWFEKDLQPLATQFLKRWAGLARSANPSLLFLQTKKGGLGLPTLTNLYKRLQVTRQAQLLTSRDPCVRHIAERHLQNEVQGKRRKFQPAVLVQQVWVEDPGRSGRSLAAAAKRVVSQEEEDGMTGHLHSLPRQGDMPRRFADRIASLWSRSISQLPQEPMKFAMNATLEFLPTNSNLYQWGRKSYSTCPLCKDKHQSLQHVLNGCSKAQELRRYGNRHDKVLEIIYNFIKENLPQSTSCAVDLPNSHNILSPASNARTLSGGMMQPSH